jgi:hypothetical protein
MIKLGFINSDIHLCGHINCLQSHPTTPHMWVSLGTNETPLGTLETPLKGLGSP